MDLERHILGRVGHGWMPVVRSFIGWVIRFARVAVIPIAIHVAVVHIRALELALRVVFDHRGESDDLLRILDRRIDRIVGLDHAIVIDAGLRVRQTAGILPVAAHVVRRVEVDHTVAVIRSFRDDRAFRRAPVDRIVGQVVILVQVDELEVELISLERAAFQVLDDLRVDEADFFERLVRSCVH